jgi:hypothetical protein
LHQQQFHTRATLDESDYCPEKGTELNVQDKSMPTCYIVSDGIPDPVEDCDKWQTAG